MKIVFLGSGAFGVPTLERLASDHTITGIVTQPDRRVGRGKNSTPTPVGQWAAEHLPGVPMVKPEKINTDEARDTVRGWESDAWVVIAYGQYLGSKLITDRFAINLHGSRLPRWRGAAPINAAIVAGDSISGNSVITIAKEMDAGFVLGQSERLIEATMTASELHHALSLDGPDLVMGVLEDHALGRVQMVEQDESLVTVAGKLTKKMGAIDWNLPPAELARKINGLSPWPGAFTSFNEKTIRILRAQYIHDPEELKPHLVPKWALGIPMDEFDGDGARQHYGFEPGVIINGLLGLVWTNSGVIQILNIQPPNKPAMSWEAFANGNSLRQIRCNSIERARFVTRTGTE